MSFFSTPIDKLTDYIAERVTTVLDARLKDNRAGPTIGSQTAPLGTAQRQFNPDAMIGDTLKDACLATAIRVISDAVAGLPFDIMEIDIEDGKRVLTPDNDHPARALFEEPNEDADEGQLFQHMVQSMIAGGNSYHGLELSGGTVNEIWQLPANPIKVAVDKRGRLTGYQFVPDGITVKAFYPKEEMLHLKLYHAADVWFGRARLEPVEREVISNYYMNRENTAFFEGGARYDLVFAPEEEMQTEQIERMKQAMAEKRVHDQIAHGMFVPPVPGKVTSLSASMAEMQFIEGLRMNREKIYGMLGLPPSLGGVLEYANYANAKIQEASFWRHTMKPTLRVIQAATRRQVFKRHFDDNHCLVFDLSDVEALQQDAAEKAKAFSILVTTDIMTRDEVRQTGYDLEPHPDGRGEEPFRAQATPSNPLDIEQPQDQDDDDNDDDPPDKRLRRKTANQFIRKANAVERGVYMVIRRHYKAQYKRVMDRINDITNGGKTMSLLWLDMIGSKDDDYYNAAYFDAIFDRDREDELLRAAMGPVYESGVGKAGQAAFDDFDMSFVFDIEQPEIRHFIAGMTNDIVTINKSAGEAIARILQAGLDEGIGADELAKRLKDKYIHLTTAQSKTIARTESTKIVNGSTVNAWKQTGEITHKQWISTRDTHTRETHVRQYKMGGYDGEIRRIGEMFIGGGDPIAYPGDGPAHQAINCRCTVLPVMDDNPMAELNEE